MTGTDAVTDRARSTVPFAVGLSAVLVVFVWSGVCAAEVSNPSSETTYKGLPYPRLLPAYWWKAEHPSFNSYCTDLWSTDGDLSAALLTRAGKTVNPGSHQSFCQLVDLTGMGTKKK